MIEVAKAAGLSQATVSKVVNGHPGVSPETVRLVRAAMKQVGYEPPPATRRRGPRSRAQHGIRTGNVALLVFGKAHRLHAGVLAAQLQGVASALTQNRLNMFFAYVNEEDGLPPIITEDRVDGVLGIGRKPSDPLWTRLKRFPLVWVTSQTTPSNDQVLPGNEAIGRLAYEYLTQQGHERLACLNPFSCYPAYRVRTQSFQFAAFQAGVKVQMLTHSHATAQSPAGMSFDELEQLIHPLVAEWKQSTPRATGMFIPDDLLTAITYRALRAQGITPGRDVQIISAANETPFLAGLQPRPATIDIGAEVMGRRAVEQLLWRMRHPRQERQVQVTIDPVIVPGELSDQ